MNANKLAEIQAFKTEELTMWERNHTATMLRQQQEEIKALKQSKFDGNNKVNLELTDDEILDTFDPHFDADIEDKELIKFAKAILRKAQEK